MKDRVVVSFITLTFLSFLISVDAHPLSYSLFKTLPECASFVLEKGQHNAYQVEGGNHFCCMCHAGTSLEKDCIAGRPLSRICRPCPFNDTDPNNQTYMDFEPHHQQMCQKSVSKCQPDINNVKMIRVTGSREKAASCECPEGMSRTGEDAPYLCVKKNDHDSNLKTTLLSDVTTSTAQPTTTSKGSVDDTTSSPRSTGVNSPNDITASTMKNTSKENIDDTSSPRSTGVNFPNDTNDSTKITHPTTALREGKNVPPLNLPSWQIVLIVCAVVFIGIVLCVFRKKMIKTFYGCYRGHSLRCNNANEPGNGVIEYKPDEKKLLLANPVPSDSLRETVPNMRDEINCALRSIFPSKDIPQLARNLGLSEQRIVDLKKQYAHNSAEFFSTVFYEAAEISPESFLCRVEMFKPPLPSIEEKIKNIIAPNHV